MLSLSCRSDVHNQNKELELVNTRSQVIVQILKAKAEFSGSVQTVEEFIPYPQYPVIFQFQLRKLPKPFAVPGKTCKLLYMILYQLPSCFILNLISFVISNVLLICTVINSFHVRSPHPLSTYPFSKVFLLMLSPSMIFVLLSMSLSTKTVAAVTLTRQMEYSRSGRQDVTEPTSTSDNRWTSTASFQEETYWYAQYSRRPVIIHLYLFSCHRI